MADFDNLFDEAMSRADGAIRIVMGAEAKVTSGALSGITLVGVFDDPENIGYAVRGSVLKVPVLPCLWKPPLSASYSVGHPDD
jgi:hypothetical protein